ncbi:nSTAND1 domain-containing NTPase [Streptomyces mirabilis]|uniref:nSTAND1 domain-containing NTPase n=1 Tax=Streptomyces mirabilis TaxID=68239 RepID=UPI0033CAC7DE
MAKRTNQGASTLSQAAAGERLPTLPVVLAYVQACGGDLEEWEARWREAAAEAAAEPRTESEDAAPPYRGLARFEPGDADLFFGRDELTDRLLTLTRSHRFSAVFGPSGSGKSSLLRAGLIPRLRNPDQATPQPAALRVLTPGEHPQRTHEQRLTPKDGDGDTWLIVDQFEELYTLCHDPAERHQFIDHLLTATDPRSRLRVVIAVRADFLGRCAEHPALTAALQDGTVLAGPMSRDELRQAIVKPAQAAGLIVERELTSRILNEVEGEPGALPLMSHALLETWRRRKGRALTPDAYEAAGGLHGAIAHTAEQVHVRFSAAQAELARRVLLRLITPGEGTPDTRRPARRTEFDFGDPTATATVLDRLAHARLVTLDDDMAEIAHEALIVAWPRLRAWIDADRERLQLHRQLTEAARSWSGLGRDSGALYRGSRLSATEEAFPAGERGADLTVTESAFLTASLDLRRREERATVRATRRLRAFVAALCTMVLLATGAAVAAFSQRSTARAERDTAVARQVASDADHLRGADVSAHAQDVSLAAQLDVVSYRMRGAWQTAADLSSAATSPLFTTVPGYHGDHGEVVISPDGHTMATGSDQDGIWLWDTSDPTRPRRLGHSLRGREVAFSPRGHLLATAGAGSQTIRLWDTTDPDHPVLLGQPLKVPNAEIADDFFPALRFSPDGNALAAASNDGTIQLWDTSRPAHAIPVGKPLTGRAPVFSSRGHVLVTSDDDDDGSSSIRLWDTTHLGVPRILSDTRPQSTDATIFQLAVSPDGGTLAAAGGSASDQAWLWDIRDPHHPKRLGAPLATVDGNPADAVAFAPDGHVLATAQIDGVHLWNIADPEARIPLTKQLGHPTIWNVTMAFTPDGQSLVTLDDKLRVWSLPPTLLTGPSATIATVAFSSDGHTLAATDSPYPRNGRVWLWDTTTPGRPRRIRRTLPGSVAAFQPHSSILATANNAVIQLWNWHSGRKLPTLIYSQQNTSADSTISALAFSPDGHTLAVDSSTSDAEQVWLADVTRPTQIRRLGRLLVAPNGVSVTSVVYSPRGDTVAVSLEDGTVRLWDTSDAAHPKPLGRTHIAAGTTTAAFSPDGHTLATGGDDGTVRLWDIADREHMRSVGKLTGNAKGGGPLAFTPDGGTVAMGGIDGTVRLWKTSAPTVPSTLTGHPSEVWAAAFSPDGHTLATGGDDGTVRLWETDPERAIRRICRVTGHALTREMWRGFVGAVPYIPPCH